METGWVVIAYVEGTGVATEEYTTPFEHFKTLFTLKCVPAAGRWVTYGGRVILAYRSADLLE